MVVFIKNSSGEYRTWYATKLQQSPTDNSVEILEVVPMGDDYSTEHIHTILSNQIDMCKGNVSYKSDIRVPYFYGQDELKLDFPHEDTLEDYDLDYNIDEWDTSDVWDDIL